MTSLRGFLLSPIALNHSYLETRKIVIGKHADLGQTPHHVASDKGLYCLPIGFFLSKMEYKQQKDPLPLKNDNWTRPTYIIVEESTNIQWVNVFLCTVPLCWVDRGIYRRYAVLLCRLHFSILCAFVCLWHLRAIFF